MLVDSQNRFAPGSASASLARVGIRHTTRYSRRNLPHWEIEGGRYFVTVRCADSLPAEVVDRLAEIHVALRLVEARSAAFTSLQRQAFVTLEKYLDAGHGACPLADQTAAACVVAELRSLADWQIDVPHFTVMPITGTRSLCHKPVVPTRSAKR